MTEVWFAVGAVVVIALLAFGLYLASKAIGKREEQHEIVEDTNEILEKQNNVDITTVDDADKLFDKLRKRK
jgi:hypothetical protein